MITFRTIGPGRAGRSLTAALVAAGGYRSSGVLGRGRPIAGAASDVDLLVIATPDSEVAPVAGLVEPSERCVVAHLSGSLGLEVLGGHPRRCSLHPLVPLPDPEVGAARLRSGITFAVDGDPMATRVARDLGGRAVHVEGASRTAYHAAASIAANHLVALIGQVERVAAHAGLPLEVYAGLVRAAAEDALVLGPRSALTGPAARGDWETVERHRAVLAELAANRSELVAYDALADLARRLFLESSGRLPAPDPSTVAHPSPAGDPSSAGDPPPAADPVGPPPVGPPPVGPPPVGERVA